MSDANVVVVNETLARKYWGSTEVIGRRLRFDSDEQGGGWKTIVGVIADVKQFGLWSPASADVYVPFHGGSADQPVHVAVRLAPDAPPITDSLRRAVWALDPGVPVDEVFTMREAISGSVDKPRFYAAVLGAFAVSAMILAAVGISGTVAYNTARRYREIGIRRALGAGPRALVLLVARQGLAAVVVGLVAGCLGAYWLAGMLSSLLFQIEPTDGLTFAVVAVGLLAVATVACLVPARRATRIDPVSALRGG